MFFGRNWHLSVRILSCLGYLLWLVTFWWFLHLFSDILVVVKSLRDFLFLFLLSRKWRRHVGRFLLLLSLLFLLFLFVLVIIQIFLSKLHLELLLANLLDMLFLLLLYIINHLLPQLGADLDATHPTFVSEDHVSISYCWHPSLPILLLPLQLSTLFFLFWALM